MNQDLESLLAELIAASPGAAPPHPEPRQLLLYHDRRLDPGSTAAVREHLVACRACAAALVDLDELEGSPEGRGSDADEGIADQGIADYGTAAAWRALAPCLAEAAQESAVEPPRNTLSATSPWWSRLAAALVLATLGLGVWGTHLWLSRRALEDHLAALEAPRANPPVFYLDALTRGDEEPITVGPDAGRVLLFLTPPEQPVVDRYRVEIRDDQGRLRVRVDDLAVEELGGLRLSFASGSLGRGENRVLLFEAGRDELLASYSLSVEPATGAS